jgi:hypothetical protein
VNVVRLVEYSSFHTILQLNPKGNTFIVISVVQRGRFRGEHTKYLRMGTLNPREYANQFREELITDLYLEETLCCPNCVITYIDGDCEGCCFYSYDEEGENQRALILNCVFDFEEKGSSMKEVIDAWVDAVLKTMKEDALVEKWKTRFQSTGISSGIPVSPQHR